MIKGDGVKVRFYTLYWILFQLLLFSSTWIVIVFFFIIILFI